MPCLGEVQEGAQTSRCQQGESRQSRRVLPISPISFTSGKRHTLCGGGIISWGSLTFPLQSLRLPGLLPFVPMLVVLGLVGVASGHTWLIRRIGLGNAIAVLVVVEGRLVVAGWRRVVGVRIVALAVRIPGLLLVPASVLRIWQCGRAVLGKVLLERSVIS